MLQNVSTWKVLILQTKPRKVYGTKRVSKVFILPDLKEKKLPGLLAAPLLLLQPIVTWLLLQLCLSSRHNLSAMAFLGISAGPAFAQIKGIKPVGLGQALL